MHEAKTNLSKLVKRALAGGEVLISTGKSRTPIVRIVPVDQELKPGLKGRPIGMFAAEMGESTDSDCLLEPMSEEELALWEAPIVSTWKNNDGDPLDDPAEIK